MNQDLVRDDRIVDGSITAIGREPLDRILRGKA